MKRSKVALGSVLRSCVFALAGAAVLSGCAANAAQNGGGTNADTGAGQNSMLPMAPVPGQTAGSGGSGPVSTTSVGPVNPSMPPNTMMVTPTVPHSNGATPLPCTVGKAVAKNCGTCHGATPSGGAPMPLVTYEDFQADHTVQFYAPLKGQTLKVYELVKTRINDSASPMPPGGGMAASDLSTMNDWLTAGAVAGGASDATCDGGTMMPPIMMPAADPLCAPQPGEQETCYELTTHGGQTPGDTSKYSIVNGEHYEQFYYKVPWMTGVQGTRFGNKFDNVSVLHHWLLFSTTSHGLDTEGTHETVNGTQLGDTAQLLAGWAVGGRDVCLPQDIGFQLPPAGGMLNLQWHYFNGTGMAQDDASSVMVCTVPEGTRPNLASMTWLGTENLTMDPGVTTKHSGSCPNDSGAPIHIWAFWPHMHTLGRHMSAVVHRAAGGDDMVFDHDFDFMKQVTYPQTPEVVLQPNDVIESTCTWDNTTDHVVDFGSSTTQEMCYDFVYSYPAGALDNGVISLIGATNTCWMLGE